MLAVAMKLDLGDKRYTTHATRLRLVRARLPDVDRLEVDLPASAALAASAGDDVKLALDGGEGEHTVFTGTIQRVIGAAHVIRVVAGGAGIRLGSARPALALEGVATKQVIEQLCDEAGVETHIVDDGPSLALYLADGRSTALAEIARLAAAFGACARVDGDGRLSAGTSVGETRGLRYRRELLAAQTAAGNPPEVSVVGTGPFAAGASEEAARELVSDFTRGGDAASSFAWRRSLAGLGDVEAVRAGASAMSERRIAAWQPFYLRTWLVPAWAPLDRVTLQDAPQRVALDEALVTRVIHCVDGGGAWTELRGVGSAAERGLP
jgi:hypothetical protein